MTGNVSDYLLLGLTYFDGRRMVLDPYKSRDDTIDRLRLNAMIADVRKGKINLIVVRDLSRFGRDCIETGKYIDIIFPSLSCRFIALNDGVDTIHKGSDMIMVFKKFMNDFYTHDTSSKKKAVRQSVCKTGKYIGYYALLQLH